MRDYPTEAQLRMIRNWKGTYRELWNYVVGLWHWPDWGVKVTKGDIHDELELHTGGWSGNESLINALEKSKCHFFMFFYEKWLRGGHYFFEVHHGSWDTNPFNQPKEAPMLRKVNPLIYVAILLALILVGMLLLCQPGKAQEPTEYKVYLPLIMNSCPCDDTVAPEYTFMPVGSRTTFAGFNGVEGKAVIAGLQTLILCGLTWRRRFTNSPTSI
jgi:hypothetical protein